MADPFPARPPKLLDRMREALRVRHYSYRTEQSYVDWSRRFIVFHGKRHPAEMGAGEVGAFLTHLAAERQVSASTQNQARVIRDRPRFIYGSYMVREFDRKIRL